MKKVIILASVLMMGIAVFGCEKKGDKNGEKQSKKSDIEQADNNNEYVIINGKKYDLSKGCDEILQEFVDDMHIDSCAYEEDWEPIRKWERDEDVYYELDKDGNYVAKEQKDFDERIIMKLSMVRNKNNAMGKVPIEDIYSFWIASLSYLNRSDFQMITPSGVGIGSTIKELDDVGVVKLSSGYYLIYLEGELINYADYVEDAQRILKLEDSEWAKELEKEFKYRCIQKEYRSNFNNVEEYLSIKQMAYMLAESDAYAQIATEEKDSMLKFEFVVIDDKVHNMAFEVFKTNDNSKKIYEDFINNK